MNNFGCVCSDESLVEESRTFESRLQSLLHDTIQESESSMEVCKQMHSSCMEVFCDYYFILFFLLFN